MIEKLLKALQDLEPQPTSEELRDALWLAAHGNTPPREERTRLPTRDEEAEPSLSRTTPSTASETASEPTSVSEERDLWRQSTETAFLLTGQEDITSPRTIRAPTPPALPHALRLSRALRPLRIRVASATGTELDEELTARTIAETGVWQPLTRPSTELLFDLALVIDGSVSMRVWRRTVKEFQALLERLGAFRDVRTWRLNTDDDGPLRPAPGGGSSRDPAQLVDSTGRRIILMVSDCTGRAWRDGRVSALLDRWGRTGPVAIVQPLPERLWWRCAPTVEHVRLTAFNRGTPNSLFEAKLRSAEEGTPAGVVIPVLAMEPRWLGPWASMVAGGGTNVLGAAVFTEDFRPTPQPAEHENLTARERVSRFRASSSPRAYELAVHLSAAPLSLPVIRLVQQAMLPLSTPADLAEIYLSELLRAVPRPHDAPPHEVAYEFHDGVREILQSGLRHSDAIRVLRNVWNVVRDNFGSSLDFPALLAEIERGGSGIPPNEAFAQVTAQVLERLGGRYAAIARRINDERRDFRAGEQIIGPLPPRNPHFTGRDELLRSLRGSLAGTVTVLLPDPLHGLGGEGKTQLAAEYAHRFAEDHDLVWWIPADQMTVARSSLVELARQLDVPGSDSIQGIIDNLLHALRTDPDRPRWLLVFDNAGDPADLLPLLPLAERATQEGPLRTSVPSGSVLITSRDKRWEERADTVDVNVFERVESLGYLHRRVPHLSSAEADQLAERVGDLPLALEQAAAWQTAPGRTVEQYLELFDQLLQSGSDQPLPANFPVHLAISLSLGLDRLSEESPEARRFFELWAFFSPEPVTVGLLSLGHDADLPESLKDLLANESALRETMCLIAEFELARFDPEQDSLQVHRLVRTMLETRMPAPERPRVRGQVHAILAAATPAAEADDETTWRQRSLITPHVLASGVINAATAEFRNVASDQAQYLYLAGDFAGAELIARFALTRWENVHGPDEALTLYAARVLANALRALGDTDTAAAHSRDTLERAENKYGPNDLITLFAALGRGADLKHLGEFEKAHELDRNTWERMKGLFGENNVKNTLFAASNLTLGLRLLGRFHEAHEIDEKSLSSLREESTPRYRDIFRVTHHLARDLHGRGEYDKALSLQRKSLDELDPVLSPDHALVLQARMNHAGTLRESGRRREAEGLASTVYDAHVRRFGEEHPNTLAAKICLAMTRMRAGRPHEAKELQEQAWDQLRRVLGESHPFVHSCAAGLAIMLRALGDVQEALKVDQLALNALCAEPDRPKRYYALFLQAGVSIDWHLLGEPEIAYQQSLKALDLLAKHPEKQHSATPVALSYEHNHVLISATVGRPARLERDPLAGLSALLGREHFSVRSARNGELLDCFIEPVPL